ncbi:hypothetical protein BU16DRAFT_196224 [Lophium mytilinum]|uniref:Uncharacterized protein n=1 Tax=Lophium mytilinum TaxID=390894 RepID=A0A6A6RAB0_9PEZI|nr:hypothetical protein BU16DRAFT_196224 [Lophium mytilinum]
MTHATMELKDASPTRTPTALATFTTPPAQLSETLPCKFCSMSLTPPRKSKTKAKLLDLSPSSYLCHKDMLPRLSKKTGLKLRPEDLHKFSWSSEPEERSMREISKRVESEGANLEISLPFETQIRGMTAQLKELRVALMAHERKFDEMAEDDTDVCIGNMVTAFIKKIAKASKNINEHGLGGGGNSTEHSTKRYTSFAGLVTAKDLEDITHLPRKYHIVLEKADQYIQDRNKGAHETEKKLARLLSSKRCRLSGEFDFWAPIFEYVYERSIEEVANKEMTPRTSLPFDKK